MKNLKKIMALMLAVIMCMAMSVTVFAVEGEGGEGGAGASGYTVTVTNATSGESYTIYKVFDAITKEGRTDGGTGISYSSTWMEDNTYFAVDAKGNITIKDAGKKADGTLSDAAITWLKSQISHFKAGETIVASGTTVTFSGLDDGYYYVTTTTGSFITVDSIAPNVEIQDKNTVPSGDKSQSATEGSGYADTTLDFNIGDTVYYQYVITNGKGSDKQIKYTDTMSDGLDLNDTITVVDKDGADLTKDTDYTLTTSEHGFILTLTETYVKSMATGDTVTVKYSATINENAAIDSATGNTNTAKLEYSNQETTETLYVETYDFQLKKTDGTNFLGGAGFKLYDAATGGAQIKVSKDATGYYVDSDGSADTEITVDSADGVNVRGLEPGTYYLEETTTPEGYNTLTARETVTITTGATAAVEITVVNNAGAELPSTGGIGTTIFYIIGACLVIGAGVLLVTRRRMNAN